MGFIIRLLVMAAGVLASWLVVQDAPNFGVLQGMIVLVLVAVVVGLLALFSRI